MPRTSDKRERLVEAAKHLIHQQGYNQTTLAEIAAAAEVPAGNVYYYFRTKEEIGAAVIDERLSELRALLEACDKSPDPISRLYALLDGVAGMKSAIVEHGCPIGSLCQELDKDDTVLIEKAKAIVTAQIDWVERQFRDLGRSNADELALQFLVTMNGASMLTNILKDPEVMEREFRRLKEWIQPA